MGKWKKGQSGNPGGRPKVLPELREMCRNFGPEAVRLLIGMAKNEDANERARVASIQELLNRGYGKVVGPSDLMIMMSNSAKNDDGGEVQVMVAFGKEGRGISLEEFAAACAHCGPDGTTSAAVGRHGSMKPGEREKRDAQSNQADVGGS
jgi:hypothetical protein